MLLATFFAPAAAVTAAGPPAASVASGQRLPAAAQPPSPQPRRRPAAPRRRQAEPQQPASQTPRRRQPLRFVWQMDDDSRFTLGSDEFKTLIGPQAAAALGQPWSEIANALGLDPEGQVARAFASRDTWSGITVALPAGWQRRAADGRTVRPAGVRPRPQLPRLSGLRRLPRCRAHQRTDEARRAGTPPRRASNRRCSATSARCSQRCRRR